MKVAARRFIGRVLAVIFISPVAMLVLLILMSFLFMFEGLAYEDDLVGGYVVQAVDTRATAAVFREIQVIPPMVFTYGWNDDLIIAKRHPTMEEEWWKVDTGTTHWYLIEVHNGKVHGPLTEQQFTGLRGELGVPDELTFTETIQPD